MKRKGRRRKRRKRRKRKAYSGRRRRIGEKE